MQKHVYFQIDIWKFQALEFLKLYNNHHIQSLLFTQCMFTVKYYFDYCDFRYYLVLL